VVTGDWRSFLLVFTLGIVSSVLAENKIFPVAILLLTFLAAGLYLLLGGKLWKLLPYASLFSVGLLLFFVGYNLLVPAAERRTLQQFIFDEETRDSYNQTLRASGNNRVDYNIGRDFAVEFAWNYIWTHTDPSVLVFGLGLGARSESKSFGLLGIALEQDGLGVVRGTGLMNLLQEMGLMGLALVAAYMSSMVYLLLKDIRRYRDSTATELRVALLIFTLLFPLWLWYKPFLFYRVTTVIYWVGIGYVFRQRRYDTFSGAR
jgi:hypothetical protein